MPKACVVVPFDKRQFDSLSDCQIDEGIRGLALESLSTLGVVDESTLEFEVGTLDTFVEGQGWAGDAVKACSEVTPR